MEGLTDFEVPSRPLLEPGEWAGRTSIGCAEQRQRRSRRAARRRLERKLAAIVALDVVGFSRLTGRDEEGAVRRLCELQSEISAIVEAACGRTVNIAGDAMLLEFPSTVAALDCALAIQDLVGLSNRDVSDDDKMLLRIGLHVGAVIVRGGDVFGEVVNVASRLEAIAEPGGVCLSHACYRQTKRRFALNFTDLGDQRLKNIAEPVRAYALRPPSSAGSPEARRIVESAPRRQVESPNVLQWPARRRASGCRGRWSGK
jgi:adenylate cyclase